MRIAIIGSGYVGLVAGACFAQMRNSVICLDNDENKIAHLKQGKLPIYEPGLAEMIRNNVKANRLAFSTDKSKELASAQVILSLLARLWARLGVRICVLCVKSQATLLNV